MEIDSCDSKTDFRMIQDILDWMAMKNYVTTESISCTFNVRDQNISLDYSGNWIGGSEFLLIDREGYDLSKCDTGEGISMQWNPIVEDHLPLGHPLQWQTCLK